MLGEKQYGAGDVTTSDAASVVDGDAIPVAASDAVAGTPEDVPVVETDTAADTVESSKETDAGSVKKPHRWRLWAVVLLLVCVAAVGTWWGWRVRDHSQAVGEYETARATEMHAYGALVDTLDEAEPLLVGCTDVVADAAVCEQLQSAVDAGAAGVPSADVDREVSAAVLRDGAAASMDMAGALDELSGGVSSAAEAVRESMLVKARADVESARAALQQKVTDLEGLIASSAGVVADDTVRVNAQGGVDAAKELLGQSVDDGDVQALRETVGVLSEAAGGLDSHTGLINESKAAHEQAQAEAAARAAAEAARQRSYSRSSGSSGGSSSGSSGSSSSGSNSEIRGGLIIPNVKRYDGKVPEGTVFF